MGADKHCETCTCETEEVDFASAKDAMRAILGREPCWQFGKNHLCSPKCVNEPTPKEIDDFVAEYRVEQFEQYAKWSDKQIRSLYEGRWR